jgi:predicted ABC-class ATPase
MTTALDLQTQLLRLDGDSYKAYQSLRGRHEFPEFTLWIDRVQSDPFATPSHCRVILPQSIAQFPPHLFQSKSREIALRDALTRQFDRMAQRYSYKSGTGGSGRIKIVPVGQAILERTSAFVDQQQVEVRFTIGLPAFGRRIAGRQAVDLFCDILPQIVESSLLYAHLDPSELLQHVETAEDMDWLRSQLSQYDLVAFIAEGALLPRRSGVDDRPLAGDETAGTVIPWRSPESLRVEYDCPNRGTITGMGIPKGITLIVGGGYHGKSTLLRAIERGIYNHIPQDGRDYVVTEPSAIKIRAEDGRSIQQVNLSAFINHLPQGKSTTQFCTDNASGSTSQAANLLEALEVGSSLLLMDEDTCATNFMIRDRRMQALISKEQEPITPLIDKIRQLYDEHGVSTLLVMGGCGDYLDVADTVIGMQAFQPQDLTPAARTIAQSYPSDRLPEGGMGFGDLPARQLLPGFITAPTEFKPIQAKVRDSDRLILGTQEIDLSAVEQLVESGQVRAIAAAILTLHQNLNQAQPFKQVLQRMLEQVTQSGLDSLTAMPQGDLVQFRQLDLACALNRLRVPAFQGSVQH